MGINKSTSWCSVYRSAMSSNHSLAQLLYEMYTQVGLLNLRISYSYSHSQLTKEILV